MHILDTNLCMNSSKKRLKKTEEEFKKIINYVDQYEKMKNRVIIAILKEKVQPFFEGKLLQPEVRKLLIDCGVPEELLGDCKGIKSYVDAHEEIARWLKIIVFDATCVEAAGKGLGNNSLSLLKFIANVMFLLGSDAIKYRASPDGTGYVLFTGEFGEGFEKGDLKNYWQLPKNLRPWFLKLIFSYEGQITIFRGKFILEPAGMSKLHKEETQLITEISEDVFGVRPNPRPAGSGFHIEYYHDSNFDVFERALELNIFFPGVFKKEYKSRYYRPLWQWYEKIGILLGVVKYLQRYPYLTRKTLTGKDVNRAQQWILNFLRKHGRKPVIGQDIFPKGYQKGVSNLDVKNIWKCFYDIYPSYRNIFPEIKCPMCAIARIRPFKKRRSIIHLVTYCASRDKNTLIRPAQVHVILTTTGSMTSGWRQNVDDAIKWHEANNIPVPWQVMCNDCKEKYGWIYLKEEDKNEQSFCQTPTLNNFFA